jgi:serine/threonine protein phosphatase PrpC
VKTRSYVASQPGPGRAISEDSFIAEDDLGLYVVCDGMGAHAAGEVASALACQVVKRVVVESSANGVRVSRKMLEGALLEACAVIFAQGEEHEDLRGMGTTATVVLLRGGLCYVAHVGDCRAYIIRSGTMNQLTRDHTVIMELVDQGLISIEEASKSPYGHILTRALGCQPVVVVDSLKVDVLPGDRILLCSDGVYPGLVSTQGVIEKYDSESSTETMPELLITESERAHGSDDMTAIEIFVESEDFCTRGAEVTLTYATLSQMTLFEEMEFSELAQIIEHTSFREVGKGEVVVRQGENGRDMFVILRGTFRVERNGVVLADIEKGDHFGDLALISGQPVSADVRALTDAALLEISYSGFRSVADRDPLIGLKLYRALASQLCEQIRILDNVYLSEKPDLYVERRLAVESQ